MKKGILIVHHSCTNLFFHDLMNSLIGCIYPILIKDNSTVNHYSTGAINLGIEYFDEFILLQDTCIIKSLNWLYTVMETEGSVSFYNNYNTYVGKYESKILKKLIIPITSNKIKDVLFERKFGEDYIKNCEKYSVCFPKVHVWHSPDEKPELKEKHGRMNVVYENEFFIKYKRCWNMNLIPKE